MATPHSTTRSARTMGTRASSNSIRRKSFVRSKGRLATTRNGSRGGTNAAASPSMTSTLRQRPRSLGASAGSSSTATTRPATRASSAVRRPLPAPTSTTRSSAPTPAARTSSAAKALRRKCWLRGGADRAPRARRPATEHPGHRHCHGHRLIIRQRPSQWWLRRRRTRRWPRLGSRGSSTRTDCSRREGRRSWRSAWQAAEDALERRGIEPR